MTSAGNCRDAWEGMMLVGYRSGPGPNGHTALIAPDGTEVGLYNLDGPGCVPEGVLASEAYAHFMKSVEALKVAEPRKTYQL